MTTNKYTFLKLGNCLQKKTNIYFIIQISDIPYVCQLLMPNTDMTVNIQKYSYDKLLLFLYATIS